VENTVPGYKTPGFWLTLVTSIVLALGASGGDLGQAGSAIALAGTALVAAGYTAFRAFKKSEEGQKPAWKTTEFWLTVGAAGVSALYASGALSDGSMADKIVGGVAAVLAALGYSVARKR
jgi:hypothetical protein